MSLLKGGIAKLALKGMKSAKMLLPATLTKVTPGTRTPGTYSAGTNPTTATYSALGLLVDYQASEIKDTLIQQGDRKVLLMGASIQGGQVPGPDDRITIDGLTFRIIDVDRDPASATYICQSRK